MAGWVKVNKGANIYTAASIIPSVEVGSQAIVGAGSVVIRDVPDNVTVAGNPAKVMRNNE